MQRSPCLNCKRNTIPECIKGCKRLHCFQVKLAGEIILQGCVLTAPNITKIIITSQGE